MPFYRLASMLLLLPALALPILLAKDPEGTPVARVGDTKITESQMRQDIGADIYEAEINLYKLKKSWIEEKARDLLFEQAAKKAKLSLADWRVREIDEKIVPPSEVEVKALAGRIIRQQQAGNQPSEAMLAQAETQAREAIVRRQISQRSNDLYQELLKNQPIKLLLKKPDAHKVNVTFSAQDPVWGPVKAPITIVTFSDFQCSYCRRGHETMKEVEKAYPGKIRLVQRQFPLDIHKRAKLAAEAALCAGDQGQFWVYADKLYANQQKLEDADLQKYAEDLKLNAGEFGQCLSSHKYAARIDGDMADGARFGVRGTPAFFINGRFLSGAQPIENFKEVIDEELARKQ
jgi:protein-disulfide isomerase